jgi:hypothetical protein
MRRPFEAANRIVALGAPCDQRGITGSIYRRPPPAPPWNSPPRIVSTGSGVSITQASRDPILSKEGSAAAFLLAG